MRRLTVATLAAWLTPLCITLAAIAYAGEAPGVSAFATPVVDLTPAPIAAPATTFDALRYRPRRYREPGYRSYRSSAVSQIHAGFLDPTGPSSAGFLLGFRGGQRVDDMVELGLGVDWRNKSGRTTEVLQETTGPGGERIVVSRELSRYSSNLFPVLAYLQVSGPDDMGLVPYAGFAGSYQALFLSAEDSVSGATFDATYTGWGWQAWAGAAVPLSGRSRLVGEIFVNNADLGRDVRDPSTGETFRETVSTNGVGARFGVNWGF